MKTSLNDLDEQHTTASHDTGQWLVGRVGHEEEETRRRACLYVWCGGAMVCCETSGLVCFLASSPWVSGLGSRSGQGDKVMMESKRAKRTRTGAWGPWGAARPTTRTVNTRYALFLHHPRTLDTMLSTTRTHRILPDVCVWREGRACRLLTALHQARKQTKMIIPTHQDTSH